MARLVTTGHVTSAPPDEANAIYYTPTEKGRQLAAGWYARPVTRGPNTKDRVLLKIALALDAPGVDVLDIINTQRAETKRALAEYGRLKRIATADEVGYRLVLERNSLDAEAELRWLDFCEAQIRPAPIAGTTPPATTPRGTAPKKAPKTAPTKAKPTTAASPKPTKPTASRKPPASTRSARTGR